MILVLSPRYSDDSRLLAQAARMLGWEVVKLTSSEVPSELRGQDCRVYAEGFLAEHAAAELGLQLLRPADDVLVRLEPEFTKRTVQFFQAKDFQRPSTPAFIKPADQKLFVANVYQPDEPIVGLESLQSHDPILVSEVVRFTREYRFFVAHREVKTGSVYWDGTRVPDVPVGYEGEGDQHWAGALQLAQTVCSKTRVDLPSSFALDVGLLESGEWAVIELNPTWTSGIYGCSPEQVLKCLESSQKPLPSP